MTEFVVPGSSVFVREMRSDDCTTAIHGDVHGFGHVTYAAKGRYKATAKRKDGTLVREVIIDSRKGRNWLFIDKDLLHDIVQLPNDNYVTQPMLDAACKAAPGVDRSAVLAAIEASQAADGSGYLHCIYAHRTPQAFAENVGQDARFDELFAELSAICETKFGQVVQDYDGWTPAYV